MSDYTYEQDANLSMSGRLYCGHTFTLAQRTTLHNAWARFTRSRKDSGVDDDLAETPLNFSLHNSSKAFRETNDDLYVSKMLHWVKGWKNRVSKTVKLSDIDKEERWDERRAREKKYLDINKLDEGLNRSLFVILIWLINTISFLNHTFKNYWIWWVFWLIARGERNI